MQKIKEGIISQIQNTQDDLKKTSEQIVSLLNEIIQILEDCIIRYIGDLELKDEVITTNSNKIKIYEEKINKLRNENNVLTSRKNFLNNAIKENNKYLSDLKVHYATYI